MKTRLTLLLLLLLLFSCGPNPDKCRTDKALLEDSFNDTACGWDEYDEEQASAGYRSSEYFIMVHQPNTSAVAVPGAVFSDVSIQAEVRQVDGAADNNYGLLCRYQDMDHFYAFLISSDGYYAIAKVSGDAPYQILSGDGTHLMPSSAIQTEPGAINELQAICTGDLLTLYVNGEQLTSVSDLEYESGDVGFIASSYGEAPIEIRFDNLIILEPALPSPESEES